MIYSAGGKSEREKKLDEDFAFQAELDIYTLLAKREKNTKPIVCAPSDPDEIDFSQH